MSNIKKFFKKVYRNKHVRKVTKLTKYLGKRFAPHMKAYELLELIIGEDRMREEVKQTWENIKNNKPLLYGGDTADGNIPDWVKENEEKNNPNIEQNQPKNKFNKEKNKHNKREPKDYPLPNIYIQPEFIFDIDIEININRENQTGSEEVTFNRPKIPDRLLTTKNLTFNQNVKLDLKNHKFGCLMNNPISSTPLYIADHPINDIDEIREYIDTVENEIEDIINWLTGFNYGQLFKHGIALIEVQFRTLESVESYSLYLFTREHIQRLANYYASRNATSSFPIITKIHDDIRLYNSGITNIYTDSYLEEFHIYRTEQLLDDLEECHIPIRNFKNYKQKGEGYRKQLQIIFINDEGETKDITIPNPKDNITNDLIIEALINLTWYFGHAKFELNFNEWGYLRHYGDDKEDEIVKSRFISLANNLSNNTIVINTFRKSIRERDYTIGHYTAFKAHIIYGGSNDENFCDSFTL